MKTEVQPMDMINNINNQLRQGWGPSVAQIKAGYKLAQVQNALEGPDKRLLMRIVDFYNYYRKITPLDQPLPDYFKGRNV